MGKLVPAPAGSAAVPVLGSSARARPGAILNLAAACVALATLSLLFPHTLTYDPWSWLLWGREIAHGSLTMTGGPSWKPLPVILDSVFSLFGRAAPDLWLILARAGSLMTLVLAYRLAARGAGALAGIVAVAWVLFSVHTGFVFGWTTFFGAGWSEGLLAALSLGAIEAHLEKRSLVALAAWFAAALIRPEAAVFLLVYGIVVVRREPALLGLFAALLLAVPVLWLVPEYLASGQLLRGSDRALGDVPSAIAHAKHPGLRDVALLRDLLSPAVVAGVGLALLLARARVRHLVLCLLGAALGWLAVVAMMAEAGYPGIPRFLVVSVSLLCVLAGIGWGSFVHVSMRRPLRLLAAAGTVAVNVALLAGHVAELHHQISGASYESKLNAQLGTALSRAGGVAAVRRCGPVSTNPLEIPVMSWALGSGSRVTYRPRRTGTIFRTEVFAQHKLLPRAPSAHSGFDLVARVGRWSVYARCRHAGRA